MPAFISIQHSMENFAKSQSTDEDHRTKNKIHQGFIISQLPPIYTLGVTCLLFFFKFMKFPLHICVKMSRHTSKRAMGLRNSVAKRVSKETNNTLFRRQVGSV